MSAPSDFADAARAWLELIDAAPRLPLAVRAEAFAAHLVHLYAAGLRLPPAGAPPDRVDALSWPADWPGFAALDSGTPDLTALLRGVTSDLATGVWWFERDPTAGAAWWRSTFDTRWGTLAMAALPRLHLGVIAARRAVGDGAAAPGADTGEAGPAEGAIGGADLREAGADGRSLRPPEPETDGDRRTPHVDGLGDHGGPRGPAGPDVLHRRSDGRAALSELSREERGHDRAAAARTGEAAAIEPPPPLASGGMLLSFEPAKPERRPTGRARAPIGEQGVLGVRCEPERDGLRVLAIHPSGPAAGALAPGDLLLEVDGVSLAGLDHATAPAALAGSTGVARRLRARRDGSDIQLSLTPVTAATLAAGPTHVPLLVLDRDAAAQTFAALAEIGVLFAASEEQEGLVELVAPPGAGAAVLASLRDGEDRGLWEILGRP